MIAHAQMWIFVALGLLLFGLELWAFFNALRFRADAYIAAGKRTKRFWVLLTGAAALVGFLCLPYPVGLSRLPVILMFAAGAVAIFFLGDVYPRLREVMTRYQQRYR